MDVERNIYGTQVARPSRTRLILALLLLAFAGGLGAMAWVMTSWYGNGDTGQTVTAADGTAPASNAAAPAIAAPAPAPTSAPLTAANVDVRMLELEQRMMHVSVAAEAAAGYANRAEAIMVAFAARRALDAGAPLGYVEGQLRLLFSNAQPKAVATIINAANDPVTVNKLRAGLEDISLLIETRAANESWWGAAMRGLGSLIVIRKADAPSPEPEQRLGRARRAVEAGQIEDAITEVAGLPPQPAIDQWLEQARRYNEAHRALDVIEAAAILEPRAAPLVPAAAAVSAATPAPAPTPAAK